MGLGPRQGPLAANLARSGHPVLLVDAGDDQFATKTPTWCAITHLLSTTPLRGGTFPSLETRLRSTLSTSSQPGSRPTASFPWAWNLPKVPSVLVSTIHVRDPLAIAPCTIPPPLRYQPTPIRKTLLHLLAMMAGPSKTCGSISSDSRGATTFAMAAIHPTGSPGISTPPKLDMIGPLIGAT